MKVMLVWTSHPGTHADALQKLVTEGGVKESARIRILFSVHGIGCGFILLEAIDYGAVANFCAPWQAVVSVEPHIVIDDEQLLEHHRQHAAHKRA